LRDYSYTANVSPNGNIESIRRSYQFEKAAQVCITGICEAALRVGHDCQLRRSSYLLPGVKGQEKYFDAEEKVTREIGDDDTKSVQRLTGDEVTSILKSRPGYYTTGLRINDSIALHPLRLVYAMTDMSQKRGVQVHEHTRVTHIQYTATTTGGVEHLYPLLITLQCTPTDGSASYTTYVAAKNIVVATNGYIGNIGGEALDELRRPGMVAHSCLMSTVPLTRAQADSIGLTPDFTMLEPPNFGYGVRVCLTPDWRVCIRGSTHYHYSNGIQPPNMKRVEAELTAGLIARFPQLAGVKIAETVSGLIAMVMLSFVCLLDVLLGY
jgi:glycine/D-amino acid oxidase-like deaminating enzyme